MGRKKKTTEEFKKEIFDLVKNEYTILSEYEGSNKRITMKHNKCGKTFNTKPSYFINSGHRCIHCYSTPKKTTKQFKQEIFKLYGDEFEILSEYLGVHEKILVHHNKCGYEWYVESSNFLRNGKCKNCSMQNSFKTHEEFIKDVKAIVGNEYSILGIYERNDKEIEIKHNKCGRSYMVKPCNFLSKNRCPHCRESKGEKAISNWLFKHEVSFIPQYKIEGCRDKNKLPFDFTVFQNEKLILQIEYDGKFHFESVDRFGGIDAFNDRKKKDTIKNTYCVTNSIPLIRIPYWEFDSIEYILENVLIHFNLINNENDTYDKEIINKYLVDSKWNHDTYLSWNDKDKRDIPMKRELIHN